jgi:hypothetical protein
VFLAREGHGHPVGVNFLEKVQLPHLASIYGAMLAGVGYVLMGAGIPLHIPGVLDAFAAGCPAEYRLAVTGAVEGQGEDAMMRFNPADYVEGPVPYLSRPRFLAIVSSNTLAATLLRRASGRVDGAESCNSPRRASRSMASVTTSTSASCANSESRSGWQAATAVRSGCATLSPTGPPGSRWEPPLLSAKNRACGLT